MDDGSWGTATFSRAHICISNALLKPEAQTVHTMVHNTEKNDKPHLSARSVHID